MGWASASPIFDAVAQKLIDHSAPEHVVTDVCAALIQELCDGDWDTLDESINRFRDSSAVMAAFRQAAPDWFDPDDEEG
jgi:hypothetical protein